jgi:hypothetical protein
MYGVDRMAGATYTTMSTAVTTEKNPAQVSTPICPKRGKHAKMRVRTMATRENQTVQIAWSLSALRPMVMESMDAEVDSTKPRTTDVGS